jgi:hypothetical protein
MAWRNGRRPGEHLAHGVDGNGDGRANPFDPSKRSRQRPPQRSGGQGRDQGLHGCEWLPAAAVFRLTGDDGGTEPNGSYISTAVTRRSRALLISNAGQPPREDR